MNSESNDSDDDPLVLSVCSLRFHLPYLCIILIRSFSVEAMRWNQA